MLLALINIFKSTNNYVIHIILSLNHRYKWLKQGFLNRVAGLSFKDMARSLVNCEEVQ